MTEWKIYQFDELGSTNDQIHTYCKQKGQQIVVQTKRQTAGRGRRGHTWQSLDGNLFFSLALEFDIEQLGVLVLISSLSVLQTILSFKPDADVALKWPNDVLLDGAKVCGILLEKGENEYMIIGIGVNVAQSPNNTEMLYPTISLHEVGLNITAEDFLQKYLTFFDTNLAEYRQKGFEKISQMWQSRAKGIGSHIAVQQEHSVLKGIFKGIDANGYLLLETPSGMEVISAGDVFYIEK